MGWQSYDACTGSSPRRLASPLELLITGVAYFAVARLGLSFAADSEIVSAVWPPAGVAVAAVVLFGCRVWPAIALGALVANATHDSSLAVAAGIAAGNALAAYCAGELLARARFDRRLRRVRDVMALAVFAAALATALNAAVGSGTLLASGVVSQQGLWDTWRMWWLGDMAGVLLAAPLLLVFAGGVGRLPRHDRLAEATLLFAILVAGAILVLREGLALAYPIFPVIVLAAIRFRQPGAVLAAAVVSTLAVGFTAAGEGPFAAESDPETNLLLAQVFVGLAALTGLLVAAMRSEWEHAEDAVARLEEGERALAEAQQLAQLGSWEWDIRTDLITWSHELFRIFGRDPADPVPGIDGYFAHVHPKDASRVRAAIERVITGDDDETQFRHRAIRGDGAIRTLQCRGRAIRDAEGNPLRLTGTVQDVSEHEVAEERFRGLLETAPDAMVIVNEEGMIAFANSQTEKLFGYKVEELIGKRVETLIPERSRAVHPAHRDRYLGDPHARPMGSGLDLTAVRKDGSEFPVEISLSPLTTDEGTLISSAIRDITERKQTEERLEHQALHDPLTGLPNRTLLVDRLEHALARSRRADSRLAVFFLDIDEFKSVNDSLGHAVGDEVLTGLPPRLRDGLRASDTIARFGGDEFVVLCEDLDSEADASRIALRLTEALDEPLVLSGRTYHLSVSVGVVIVEGGRAGATEVLRDADLAMYRAKRSGRGRFELFDGRMRSRVLERLEIESDLRDAVEREEFELHYQPIYSIHERAFTGAEALVRWRHPTRGLLAPAEFIEVAEDTGLIVPIGNWVIREACRAAASWPHPDGAPIEIGINLSPRQVAESNVAAQLAAAIAETGIDARRIFLEITENVLLDGGEASIARLRELRGLGAGLVLDDFGTGYSSLSRLNSFPLDVMKLDREFVMGLGTGGKETAIVSSLLGMARGLELVVIAEGVETPEQLAWLEEQGCDCAQGYLLSPPVPLDQLERIVPWTRGVPAGDAPSLIRDA